MSDQKFKIPTERVELPSKGLLYSKDNPLSAGFIEMKYMTAREEDILTNQNFIKQGVVFDKLLESLIVSKISFDDMIIGDKNAILIAARILGYGKDYSFRHYDSTIADYVETTVDLSQLKNKEVDYSQFKNENNFEFVLPDSKNIVTYKILTHGDEKKIDQELKGLKKVNLGGEITTRLKHTITSINGDAELKSIRQFVDNYLLASDARALREEISSKSPDIDLKFDFTNSEGHVEEGVSMPIGLSFFYPTTGV